MKGRLRVLVVGDGASVHTQRHVAAISQAGLQTYLATFEGPAVSGVNPHRLGTLPSDRDIRYGLAIPRLARYMRLCRPNVVHAHYVSSYGLMTALALRAAFPGGKRPTLIQSAWGYDLLVKPDSGRAWRLATSVALRSADLITWDSQDLRETAQALAPDVESMRFAWGPPPELFTAQASREHRIVVARGLRPHTRVELVVQAYRRARVIASSALDGWQLTVIGDGPSMAVVREAANDDPSIDIRGELPLDELRSILGTASIFTNVPATDATSAILLDSLALGLIPVVNDLPAYREWIDGSIGEVVSKDPSADELAMALIRATSRVANTAEIRSRVSAVRWDLQVDALISAYHRMA